MLGRWRASVCRACRDAVRGGALRVRRVVIEFLGVFEQKCRAQIGSFGAIKPADCFVASFVWQFFVEFVSAFRPNLQVLRYGIVSRHVFQLGNGFV